MTSTLVLLPGLAADARLFRSQQEAFPGLQVPSWPTSTRGLSLPTFAAHLADSIPRSRPLFVGGSSFGGMVALELAALLKPAGVILIGSCRTPAAVTPLARALRSLIPALPVGTFRPRRWALPLASLAFGQLATEQRELPWTMASRVPPSFLKWGIEAILSWRPTAVGVAVHQIHGRDDRLIPLRLVRPHRVVEGGGHLLPLTHPAEVNAFLLGVLSGRA